MPSAERIALVERLVRENKSNKEIAEILGIKQNSVRSTIRKCGVERDKNKPCKICGKPVGTANPKAMYCKECGVNFCDRLGMDCPGDSDFFCSYGERKEEPHDRLQKDL